jgi:hypothetical protein
MIFYLISTTYDFGGIMPPNNEPLIYRQESEIAYIEINRPDKKNALNFECWQLLDRYCDQLIAENQIGRWSSLVAPLTYFRPGWT